MKSNNKTHKEIAAFYNGHYYKNIEHQANIKEKYHFKKLAEKINISRGQSILDVACGQGDWLLSAHNRGAIPHGLDISYKAIKRCHHHLPEGYFSVGLGEQLPYKSNSYDYVTCLGSLEHFLDQNIALEEFKRVAKRDAYILILVPNSKFLTARLGLYKGTNQKQIRETPRSIKEWIEMFNSAELKVQQSWGDLHILSMEWITRGKWYHSPLRFLQAVSLIIWPLNWQYQIYFLCRPSC